MNVDSPLPSFDGATDWLNRISNPREFKGHPTLVHFWSIHNEPSTLNMSQVASLRDERKRDGLRVVAVHLPQSDNEKNLKAVRDAISRLNITEPCAIDNERRISVAFGNKQGFVPAYYLFDTEGKLRKFAGDESGLETIEDALHELLTDERKLFPFCAECELFLDKDAMYCSECGMPLLLPGTRGVHPYYEHFHSSSLPTVRLKNPDPLIGQTIGGKYQLTARLGEGGMAVVYRAHRLHIGDEVAVKILLKKFVSDEFALERFRREARSAAMLHHPNVITIHDFGETGDENAPAFIVMEFVKGAHLREILSTEGRFPAERALRLMRGICAGVGAAHRQGVVHRDLKPENIVVLAPGDDSDFETVRVLDFGLAKLVADAGVAPIGTVVGTPYYMSPEQCLGEPLDARSDVYSLGAMLYEMLSGNRPFIAETVSGLVNKHLREEPPPFPPLLNVPRRVATTVMRALAKDPDQRPQNATELGRLL